MTSGSRQVGLVFAIVACAAFATSGPVAKSLMEAGVEPQQAAWLRLTGAAVILIPVVFLLRGREVLRSVRRAWPQLLAYGLVGMAASQTLFFFAASRLPVGVAILLQFSGPLLIIAWTRLVRRRPVPRSATIGVVISLMGLMVVVEVWSGIAFDPLGLLAGIGSAFCQATYFILIEDLKGSADVLIMTTSGAAVAAIALGAVTMPWTFPWEVLAGPVAVADGTVPGWLPALWLILICAILAYLLEGAAVRRLSAVVGGAIAYIEVVFAAVIAWLLLGESLGAAQIIGGAMVIVGAYISQRPARGTPLSPNVDEQIEFPGMVGAESVHRRHE